MGTVRVRAYDARAHARLLLSSPLLSTPPPLLLFFFARGRVTVMGPTGKSTTGQTKQRQPLALKKKKTSVLIFGCGATRSTVALPGPFETRGLRGKRYLSRHARRRRP